jgi:UDP-N-acetylglucosamine 2-epimerase (non-hydrolysing)
VKVAVVFGTRPEVIKLAPVINELRRRDDVSVRVVATGQHRELLDQALKVFDIRPDVDLDLMRPTQSLAAVTSRLLPAMDAFLAAERPDLVLVQGDTTSAFAAALATFYRGITVGHVEAGLRTADSADPFPEEINRRLTAVVAAMHFSPTVRARAHLLAEGVDPSSIFVTGNTVVDALHHIRATETFRRTVSPVRVRIGERLLAVTLHRRESWGAVLGGMCSGLRTIVRQHPEVRIAFPVHPNPAVRSVVSQMLGDVERCVLLEPLDYLSFLALVQASWLVLTDSGGVQEEAPTLGVPVLVLRKTTERPEAIEHGVARLVGTEPDAIVAAASELLADSDLRARMTCGTNPFGDGRASARIVDLISQRAPSLRSGTAVGQG